ncbi:MAG: class I SAM-dependent methyltransferase [Frankiaceae bacterium]|nr:class I SAM-dependent methyltransferase [Frankiaceae bacterium]MBV9870609.1 class I SAM-dependent methyltransferase [Frankiaceae bacterium]
MAPLSDDEVAAIYDLINPWDPDASAADRFYSNLVMMSQDVLDVGCGTGSLLHTARRHGHRGRLTGVDPDPAMLSRARRRTDIEWRLARAEQLDWIDQFDLATMTSHAFQCLITDEEIHRSLVAVGRCLRPGGRFAFESRHPQARAWEVWSAAPPSAVRFEGRDLSQSHRVESVVGDVVTFTELTTDASGAVLREDTTSLRFLDPVSLAAHLTEAGYVVDSQSGDWFGAAIDESSTEIVTVARR